MLIDCGASHNFILADLVRKLGLPSKKTLGYGGIMGTRLAVQGPGVCKGVQLSLQNIEVIRGFSTFESGELRHDFGNEMLSTLGQTKIDWRALMMKLQIGETTMTLQGDLSLSKTLIALKAMMKAFKREKEYSLNWAVWGLTWEKGIRRCLQKSSRCWTSLRRILKNLWGCHHSVIEMMPSLSSRERPLINVWPYCYPMFRKMK